ncbi:MAG: DUF2017 family protein [Acidimicrobiia bacterium]|nr:DUF2017 family protein [Acidimicrobiia bacterium]
MPDAGAFSRAGPDYRLTLGAGERALLARLLAELRTLLLDPHEAAAEALARLFPVVHPDDPAREAEYQRLMRDELVASRLAGIAVVEEVLAQDGPETPGVPGVPGIPGVVLDEEQLGAFMQAVNSVRLVLGTVLDVSEDDSGADDTGALAPEYHLYAFLSWVLDSAVAVASPDLDADLDADA